MTAYDAILDRTLRNDLQRMPTARNSSADKSQQRRRIFNSIVSQEPVKDEPLSAVAASPGQQQVSSGSESISNPKPEQSVHSTEAA